MTVSFDFALKGRISGNFVLNSNSKIFSLVQYPFFSLSNNNINLLTSSALEKNQVHNSPSVSLLLLYLHLRPAESSALPWLIHLCRITLLLCGYQSLLALSEIYICEISLSAQAAEDSKTPEQ